MNFFEPKLKLFCSQSTKVEEQCSLNDLLKMYMCVKTISKNLDDYDHIKLITEEEPLQVIVRITMSSANFLSCLTKQVFLNKVDFEERPIYRNIIGKLLLNHQNANDFFANEANKLAIGKRY